MNCPLCGDALSERGIFCKACAGQVRCMDCRAALEPGASACVECGNRVGQRSTQSREVEIPISAQLPSNRNTLSFHEDRNTRHFEASLTDGAMQGLGDVFGELFVQRGGARAIVSRHLSKDGQTPTDGDKRLPAPAPSNGGSPAHAETLKTPEVDKPVADRDPRITRIFTAKGDTFELTDNRLKAANQSDYMRRLTYLALYAFENSGKVSAPEEAVRAILRDAKVWDGSGNANRWLKKRIGISNEGEDGIKLTATGREEAVKALSQISDPNVGDKWNPDKNSPKNRVAAAGKKKE